MKKAEVIDWFEKKIRKYGGPKTTKLTDEELQNKAKDFISRLNHRNRRPLLELLERGESKEVEEFIKAELKRPPLSDKLREWVRKTLDSYYRPRYSKSLKTFKQLKLPPDFVEKSIASHTGEMFRKIELMNPPDVKEFVTSQIRIEEYFNEISKIRQALGKADVDDEKKIQKLYDVFERIRDKMEETDPQEIENSRMFFSHMATDFGAYFSRGRAGNMASVFTVQTKLMEKAVERLSKKKEFEPLAESFGILSSVNFNSRGVIHLILAWASERATDDDFGPPIQEAKAALNERIAEIAKEKPSEKKKLESLSKAFDQACSLAEANAMKRAKKS